MRWETTSRSLRRRILFLLGGNLFLLLLIALMLKEGSSFTEVLTRSGGDVAPVVLAGLGMTGIIAVGAIDLSIASVIAVAGTVFGMLYHNGAPPWLCYLALVLVPVLLSCWNGTLVRTLGVPAIIVTLAGLPFYRGVALILAELGIENFSGNISVHDEAFHIPGKDYPGWILWITVAVALAWEGSSKTSRRWLALGSSEEACRLMGLSPGRIFMSAFFAGGFFLGLAALIYVTRIQAVEPARMALGFELHIIGAVVLGGTNIFGGEGSYAGTLLGAFFLYFISQALTYAGASPYFQEAITGLLIISVIGLDCALHRKQKWLEELA